MMSPSAAHPRPEALRVFLSHSTKDGVFVQRLADALTGAGFARWLCEVDIETGENFVSRINDGLANSDVALLVWSPDAARSAWTFSERNREKPAGFGCRPNSNPVTVSSRRL